MVDFQSLTSARPELLDRVAETFNTWSDALDKHATQFQDEIIHQITQPTVGQAQALGWTVDADGTVTVPPLGNVPAGEEQVAQAALKQQQKSAKALTEQIRDAIPYHNYFGKALEAATLHGNPDARAAAIAGEVINDFGTRDHKGTLPPMPDNLKDSVGRIISGYIGDANDAVADYPVRSSTWDDPAIPGGHEQHAVFDKNKLLVAMGEAAKDPDTYVTMYNAERAYSALSFDYAAGDTGSTMDGRASLLEQNAKQSVQIFGALDDARADAIREGHAAAADKAYNEAIERRGGLANAALGPLIEKIPVVGNDLARGTESYVDTLVENSKQDSSGLSAKETAELYGDGRRQAAQLAAGAIHRPGHR